ncbi:hypothetical protein EXE48_11485 [Halorubrum sp. ASP1]|uniref:hypothetical protein n=1 Tax=Halorubrum sp. ASP1 TaxID=2518114 RepID=UPI0010F66EC4|nr:hypothetical protein [Halorubrum sp. ASP1]TKX60588.1 hypothetical protein EXE48_11485 [Halorubrum sp. ASP1]
MDAPTSLDEVVDIVANNEPVTPEDVYNQIESNEISQEQVENLLSVALKRERILEVNDKFWVMRVGKYADNPDQLE